MIAIIDSSSLRLWAFNWNFALVVCAFSPATRIHIQRVWFISHHFYTRLDPTPDREREKIPQRAHTFEAENVFFFFLSQKMRKKSFRRISLILYMSRNDAAKKFFLYAVHLSPFLFRFISFFFLWFGFPSHTFQFLYHKKKTKKSSLLAFLFFPPTPRSTPAPEHSQHSQDRCKSFFQ